MDKKSIRAAFRQRRSGLTTKQTMELQQGIQETFHGLRLPSLRMVHRYVANPAGGEPDPAPLVEWLKIVNPDLVVALPRVEPESSVMQAVEYDGRSQLLDNRWGIPEPVQGRELPPEVFDIVLVPLLAFDRGGHRVGYGKGYYDRLLVRCRTDCIKAGLSFFDPVDAIEDVDGNDVRLDLCITPFRVYEFD